MLLMSKIITLTPLATTGSVSITVISTNSAGVQKHLCLASPSLSGAINSIKATLAALRSPMGQMGVSVQGLRICVSWLSSDGVDLVPNLVAKDIEIADNLQRVQIGTLGVGEAVEELATKIVTAGVNGVVENSVGGGLFVQKLHHYVEHINRTQGGSDANS